MAAPADRQAFERSFSRWARRVRGRLALGRILSGAAAGLGVGSAGTGALWYFGYGDPRPWMAVVGVVGGAVGWVLAARRRWADADVALFLDGRLDTKETIATAHELATEEPSDSPVLSVVVSKARTALDGASAKRVRAPLWRPMHGLIPVAGAVIAYLSWIPLPPLPEPPPPPPGAELVELADVEGLDEIIALTDLDPRDEAQRERLERIAEDAKKLKEKLAQGMEKREAQDEIARLKDEIVAERMSLGDGERRAGLEAAISAMEKNPDMKGAAEALGDRDFTELDESMRELANRLEKESRDRAAETLEEAAEAARRAGAEDVAKELEEQKRLLEERMRESDKLRELAKALGEGLSQEGAEALESLDDTGDVEAQRRLTEELEKALGELSEEERKQLAENLRERAKELAEQSTSGPTPRELGDMADKMDSAQSAKELAEQLKEMAKKPSPEAERQKALEGAQEGAAKAQSQLGMPVPTPGNGDGSKGKPGNAGKGDQDGQPGGPSPGGGPGDHAGETGKVAGQDLRAHAGTPLNPGAPMPGTVTGRAPGKAGETANVRGTGALGVVGPDEVGALDHSEVPEEYREQVGRYFQTN